MPVLEKHRNPGLEIVYVSRGHLLWEAEGRVESVPRGSVFFTLPNQEHGSAQEFEPGHEWWYVILAPSLRRGGLFPEDLQFSTSDIRNMEREIRGSARHSIRASGRMATLLPELVLELENPGAMHTLMVENLTRAVVLELVRSLQQDAGSEAGSAVRASSAAVRNLVQRIAATPDAAWTLPEMALASSLGRTQLAAHFVELTGDTPMRFVNRMRIRKACRLLRETGHSITHIAMECGYETSQYFATVFKSFTGGLSPGGYRRRNRA